MFFYEIGYSDWESHSATTLWHHVEYEQDQFNQLVLDAYVKASKQKEIEHNEWFEDWVKSEKDEYLIDSMRYKPSVSDLNHLVVDILISEHGFKNLNIKSSFIPFESSDLKSEEDKSDGEYITLLKRRFGVVEKRDSIINNIIDKD
jgi:hypothetical protein